MREIIVDSFAGAGGASTGILWAVGRHPDIAINHDPDAIECHRLNHPDTHHYLESVWDVDPVEACAGRPVGLMWASPDCTHFSRAKGAAKVSDGRRGLAWVAINWAREVSPRVIILENVEEFRTWGPLDSAGRPDKSRAGETFGRWLQELEGLGYVSEFRTLQADHYGAPTSRRRLFMVARRDGEPIIWPEPRPGSGGSAEYCVDWTISAPSIFGRKKPLAPATLDRIAAGLERFVYSDPDIRAGAAHWIAKHYTGVVGQRITAPLGTVTAIDHHSLVSAFLIPYYGSEVGGVGLDVPLRTVTCTDRFALVEARGEKFKIVDVGMRMLQPHELAAAQGFPASYKFGDATKRTKVRLIGNSVCPPVAAALVRANYEARS